MNQEDLQNVLKLNVTGFLQHRTDGWGSRKPDTMLSSFVWLENMEK